MSATVPLFAPRDQEIPAEGLLPCDRIRWRGQTLTVERVAVTHGAPVQVRGRTLSGRTTEFEVAAAQLVLVLA